MIECWEDFKKLLDDTGYSGPRRNRKKDPKIYILTYPDKVGWNHSIYRQAQMTYMQISGGDTGAGSGHHVILCRQSEVRNVLLECVQMDLGTHAMICSVGMLFVVTITEEGLPKSGIVSFDEFSKTNNYMRAHIIAKPNQKAHIHHQHVELNLDIWKTFKFPNIFDRWEKYIRSDDNYHDDYTPSWIKPKGLPKIINFPVEERNRKVFSYHRNQKDTWKRIESGEFKFNSNWFESQPYFRGLTRNFSDGVNYYVENNEKPFRHVHEIKKEFDLIISPCGGYSTEYYSNKLNLSKNTEIVLYDHDQNLIDIKKMTIDMKMPFEDIKKLEKLYEPDEVSFVYNLKYQEDRWTEYGDIETLINYQREMDDNYDVEFWLMNLIEPDYNRIIEKVKGKNVFLNTSNIFSYHKVLLYYPLDVIWESYNKLEDILKSNCNDLLWIGTNPNKCWRHLK